ncbi:hypothetical protein L9F63_018634, partial [Diploptera punctata]
GSTWSSSDRCQIWFQMNRDCYHWGFWKYLITHRNASRVQLYTDSTRKMLNGLLPTFCQKQKKEEGFKLQLNLRQFCNNCGFFHEQKGHFYKPHNMYSFDCTERAEIKKEKVEVIFKNKFCTSTHS